jgi:glycosyltransferase involved in cell wall biosynthesis
MAIAKQQNKVIAFVSNSAWSVYNFRLDVIMHLLERGYEILVLAPDDEYSRYLRQLNCKFIPLHFNNKTENPIEDYFFFRQLKKLYRQHRPDFIFHYVAKPNIYGSLAAASLNIPSVAVITGLGYPFAKRNWLYWLVKQLYKKALKKTTQVWFLNNEDAKVFVNEKIVNIEKIKVLPGEGINTDFFSPDYNRRKRKNDRFIFLMSTRLLKSKGVGLYADAARILKKKNYDTDFYLIGFFEKNHPDSISHDELKRWQRERLIYYNGFAKDVRPYLSNADCLVFPSFYNEGIPRCLMEASSMELPIITSMNRGCKEVVLNNSTGYLCNVNDPFDLADKMEKMINLSAEERSRMGKNGRLLVSKKFNVTKVIEEYEDTLNYDLGD